MLIERKLFDRGIDDMDVKSFLRGNHIVLSMKLYVSIFSTEHFEPFEILICFFFLSASRMVRMIGDEFLTEERDRKYYADHYTCCPPPLFIILITLVEVSTPHFAAHSAILNY